MDSQDSRMNPNTAPVWGQGSDQPYARRSILNVFLIVGLAIGLIAVLVWWFFKPASNENQAVENSTTITIQQPGNRYAEDTGRSAIYDFFYKMFGGIEDGLEDSPHNLENVEQMDNLNLQTITTPTGNIVVSDSVMLAAVEDPTVAGQNIDVPKPDDGYRHSVYDVIGSDVRGVQGHKTGTVHDILIHKKTGEAKGIILNEDGIYYDRDLKILKFTNVIKQDPDGDVTMTVTEDTMDTRPDFHYGVVADTDFISLRNLRDGQILDHNKEFLGQIDAVIYQDAEAQSVYFKFNSTLFNISYGAVKIIKNADGYDIQLSEEQTKSLRNGS